MNISEKMSHPWYKQGCYSKEIIREKIRPLGMNKTFKES